MLHPHEPGLFVIALSNSLARYSLWVEPRSLWRERYRACHRSAALSCYKPGGLLILRKQDLLDISILCHCRQFPANSVNRYSPVVVICPLTIASHVSRLYPSDVLVREPEGGLRKDSVVLTLQVRAVAKARLLQRLGGLEADTLTQIDQALNITLDLL